MRVLLLGDSHTVGGYGGELARLFQSAGASVVRLAHVGANAGDYLTGKYASEYNALRGTPFDLVVLTLGTNDAAASDYISPSKTADRIKALAEGLTSRSTWYVGPPAFSNNAARTYNKVFATEDLNSRAARVFNAVRSIFGDRAIDPRPATAPFVKQTDIHLGQQGGAAWAKAVFDRIAAGAAAAPGNPAQTSSTASTDGGSGSAAFPMIPVLFGAVLALLWLKRRRKSK